MPRNPKRTPNPPQPSNAPPEIVDPRWLLKALGATLLAAAVLAYLTLCLLLYQGSWQRFLSPSHLIDKTPAAASIPFSPIRFDAAETGTPRLAGWWIPSPSGNPLDPTILFLHDGAGSLSTTVPTLILLHQANVNIFAFDYRGFGQSDPTRPNEARMSEDASAALRYLLETRHLNASQIIPYGQGLGAVFAAKIAASEPQIPALIIDNPDPFIYTRVASENRARFLPMTVLIRDRFDLAAALSGSAKPKLLLANSPDSSSSPDRAAANQEFFRTVPTPKFTVTFPPHAGNAYVESINRFLDQYLPAGAH